jgi:hypothetical protein
MTRRATLVTTVVLITTWLVATFVFVAVQLPAAAKMLPYLGAGVVTGMFVRGTDRRAELVAVGGLTLASAVGWTAHSWSTTSLDAGRGLMLFAISLPLHAIGGAWAWLGLFIVRRARARRTVATVQGPPDHQALADELRLARARATVATAEDPRWQPSLADELPGAPAPARADDGEDPPDHLALEDELRRKHGLPPVRRR